MLPGVLTPPIPLSMVAESAFPTKPQLSVVDCPGLIVVADAVKNSMTGVPEHTEALTFRVTCAVAVVDPQFAVSVYVVVVVGLTVVLPGVGTPPIPLSMTAAWALLTKPQLSVADSPDVMVSGETVKDAILGVPEQPRAGAGAGAGVKETTLIFAHTVVPNGVPSGLCSRQKPCADPGVAGAVIGTSKSAVAPGAVFGTPMGVSAPILSPLTNAKVYPSPHSHVPELRSRQILLKA